MTRDGCTSTVSFGFTRTVTSPLADEPGAYDSGTDEVPGARGEKRAVILSAPQFGKYSAERMAEGARHRVSFRSRAELSFRAVISVNAERKERSDSASDCVAAPVHGMAPSSRGAGGRSLGLDRTRHSSVTGRYGTAPTAL